MTPESAVVLSSSSSELAVKRPKPIPAFRKNGLLLTGKRLKTRIAATTVRLPPPPECSHQSASTPTRTARRNGVSMLNMPATPPLPSPEQNVHVNAPDPLLTPSV